MLDLTQPPSHPLVAASILSADFGTMADECRDVLDKGADLLHIDVMDGHFVGNLTMGQDMIAGIRRHCPDACLDVHLMVERPEDYIGSFAKAGANVFSFHLEVCHDGGRTTRPTAESIAKQVRDSGMLAGMVINPPTRPDALGPLLDAGLLDLALVMSVNPGRSGQSFMPEVLEKTRWLRDRAPASTRVEMDGGVNLNTVDQAVAAGADVLVTASALFGSDDRRAVIEAMQNARR